MIKGGEKDSEPEPCTSVGDSIHSNEYHCVVFKQKVKVFRRCLGLFCKR